jgi:uncharacterized membrane protein YqjE
MIDGPNHQPAGLATLVGRVARVTLRGVESRLELLAVEWQQERLRLMDLLAFSMALLLLGTLGALLLTITIIFLFPAPDRIYVTAGFAVLYLLAAAGVWLGLRAVLKRQPFAETIEQVKKDRLWLESLK